MHSNHGLKPAGFNGSIAKINQDRGLITYPLAGDSNQMLIGVYDGHGSHGELVSEFASFTVADLLDNSGAELQADAVGCISKNVILADSMVRKQRNVPSMESGSTAIITLLRPDKCYTACVGDSRCVKATLGSDGKSWKAVDLSEDQKPDTPAEKVRIESLGGFVSPASDAYGPARVWRGAYGLGPGLAMARSMGDHAVAELGVHSEPEIVTDEIKPEDQCLILASDGVWEFITSQQAVDIVYKNRSNAQAASKALIKESAARWKQEEGNYRDDITAIVIMLPILSKLSKSNAGSYEFDADNQHVEKTEGSFNPDASGVVAEAAPVRKPQALEGQGPTTFAKRRLSVALDDEELPQA